MITKIEVMAKRIMKPKSEDGFDWQDDFIIEFYKVLQTDTTVQMKIGDDKYILDAKAMKKLFDGFVED